MITMYKDQTTGMLLKYACECACRCVCGGRGPWCARDPVAAAPPMPPSLADTSYNGTRDLSKPPPQAEKVYATTERSWYTGSNVNETQWCVPQPPPPPSRVDGCLSTCASHSVYAFAHTPRALPLRLAGRRCTRLRLAALGSARVDGAYLLPAVSAPYLAPADSRHPPRLGPVPGGSTL